MQKKFTTTISLFAACAATLASTRGAAAQDFTTQAKVKLPPGAKIILVDDDRQQYKNAPFSLINNAILSANAGDVIRVAPGLYRENVVLDKNLRLEGAQAGKSATDKKRLSATSDIAESVIQPVLGQSDGTGIRSRVEAQASTIDGFTVRGFGAAGSDQFGITGGAFILNNRVFDTTVGLGYSLVSNVTIQGNSFFNNRSKNGASLPGYGIYFEGSLGTVLIDNNLFAGNGGANIFSSAANATDVTISNNLMDSSLNTGTPSGGGVNFTAASERLIFTRNTVRGGNGNAFSAASASNASITRNVFSGAGANGSSIVLTDDTQNTTVSQNQISGNSGNGIVFLNANLQSDNVNAFNTISKNNVINNGGIGIVLQGSIGNKVEKNVLTGNQSGISLVNTSDNQVQSNTISGNRVYGIFVSQNLIAIGGNVFTSNKVSNSGSLDIRDETIGDGTAGTDNIYRSNKATSASPVALLSSKK